MLTGKLTPAPVGSHAGEAPPPRSTVLSRTWEEGRGSVRLSQNARESRAGEGGRLAPLTAPQPGSGVGRSAAVPAREGSFAWAEDARFLSVHVFSPCFKDSDSIGEVSWRAGLGKRVSRLCPGRKPGPGQRGRGTGDG